MSPTPKKRRARLHRLRKVLKAIFGRRRKRVVYLKRKLSRAIKRDGELQRSQDAATTDEQREEIADEIEANEARMAAIDARIKRNISIRVAAAHRIKRVGKRIRRLTKKIRAQNNFASPHFTFDEFDCHDGTKVPTASYPALRHLCQTYLEPLRKQFGSVHVNSGYRTRSYNASIGGASMSQHIYPDHWQSVAADITVAGASPSAVASFLDRLNPGGLGRYSSFTHVDNRQRSGSAHARWTG